MLAVVLSFNDKNGRILLKYYSNQSCYGWNVCRKISPPSHLGCLFKPNSLVRILATVWLLTMIFTFRIFMIIFCSFNDVTIFNFVVWSVYYCKSSRPKNWHHSHQWNDFEWPHKQVQLRYFLSVQCFSPVGISVPDGFRLRLFHR